MTASRRADSSLRGNRLREVPTEFLTVNRSEADWLALRKLLDHEKVCAKLDQTPDPELFGRRASPH